MSEWKFFTDEELQKWIGPRCPDVEPGCAVCKAWARRDMLRHWEYEDEQDRLEFSQYEDPDPHAGSEWTGGQECNPFVFTPGDEVPFISPRSLVLLDKILGEPK
jgi:hypothetical protein